jgi:L-fucose isomerase-like protein
MFQLFITYSEIESESSVKSRVSHKLNLLGTLTDLDEPVYISSHEQLNIKSEEFCEGVIIFISSGGSETITKAIIEKHNKPTLLVAIGSKNSLAASIEIYSYLKTSYKINLLYLEEDDSFIRSIKNFCTVCKTIERLNSARIGIIGKSSDWLLHSNDISSIGQFKSKFIQINTESISKIVNDLKNSDINEEIHLLDKYNHDLPEKSISDSLKVYIALKRLVKEFNLDALSVRCFDLLESNYTACMGMSICNDEGIVSGCEGDIHALFSMMMGSYLTNEPCWMANPSMISIKNNTLVLAHCTVPSKMIADHSSSSLTTHMESGISVANHGPLQLGEVTIFRIGGNFDKIVAAHGEIVETDMRDPSLCRTQANIKLNCLVTDWIENTLGNHQVLVYGDISNELKMFTEFSNLELKTL